jgi:hypothetical protein
MKTIVIIAVALVACVASYVVGYRAGTRKSLLEQDRRGLLVLTLGVHDAMEATNWAKARSMVDTELLGFTRDYERHFGVPSGTDSFASRFARAKAAADQIERRMVPLSSITNFLPSNTTIRIGREKQ